MAGETKRLPLTGVRAMVVDHYEPLRWLKAHLLRKRGAQVVEAISGSSALSVLAANAVDIVLVDCGLSDVPAGELRKQMRENAATATIPVIYISASEAEVPPPDGEGFLRGPLDSDELAITILLVLGVAALLAGTRASAQSAN